MNKGEFVDKLVAKAGFSNRDARKALDGMIGLITNEFGLGEEVLPAGFGKFEARVRKESKRKNLNPGGRLPFLEKLYRSSRRERI